MQNATKNIQSLIRSGGNKLSRTMSYVGLGIGILLLLLSLQMFVNIQQVLGKENPRKNGYDFISISKSITNQNMGQDNTFTLQDLQNLNRQPQIEEVSPLVSNQYQVSVNAGNMLPFSTDLFLESMDDQFLDTLPPHFSWEPGQAIVPLIFSSDFLELYNVFAPAQGLPQISPQTITSVNIFLECAGPEARQTFRGRVVALSDRVNAVLVPQSFMNWSNQYFSGVDKPEASRVYIKTKDANDPALISYLDQNGYHLNKEKVKFGRLKSILQNVIGSLGLLGLLVMFMALIQFSFYIQLIIARSKDNLKLLITLGFSPKWLAEKVAKIWLPLYFSIIIIALLVTQVIQFLFSRVEFVQSANINPMVHWSVFLIAVLLLVLTLFINTKMVKNELNKIG